MNVVEAFAKKNELYHPSFCTKKGNSTYYYVGRSEDTEADIGLPVLIKENDGHCEVVEGKEVFDILSEVNSYK